MSSLWLLNCDLAVGGAERHLVSLARAWAPGEQELAIVLLAGCGSLLREVPPRAMAISLSSYRPGTPRRELVWAMRIAHQLAALLRSHRPAAILSFLPLPTLIASLALRALPERPKLVWSVQTDIVRHYGQALLMRPYLALLRRFALPRVDLFIAPSSGIRDQLENALRVSCTRIQVIPNALDSSWLDRLGDPDLEPVPAKQTRYRLITVGRCAAEKGYDRLLAALAEMRHRDVELCLLGDGPLRPCLQRRAAQLGLAHRVRFAGFVSDPYAWLATADVFVSSSRWETFGIAIAEAMACGLPVVATATDGARELICPEVNGLLAPVDQPEALAAAIDTLLDDTALRVRLARAAAERARGLDLTVIGRRYADAIAQVL